MKLFKVGIILFLFSHLFHSIVSADTMRCGNRLISTGDTKAKVLIRCGKPILTEIVGGKSSAQTRGQIQNFGSDYSSYTDSTTSSSIIVEKWTYYLGEGKFLRILTFEGGKLRKIETGDRP